MKNRFTGRFPTRAKFGEKLAPLSRVGLQTFITKMLAAEQARKQNAERGEGRRVEPPSRRRAGQHWRAEGLRPRRGAADQRNPPRTKGKQ